MSQTRSDILETLRIFLSDPKDQKWSKAHKVKFLNQTIKDVISSEVIPYVRVAELPIRDYEYEYDFPEDMLEPIAMMFQNIEGAVVISSSWRSMVAESSIGSTLVPHDNSVFWQAANHSSGHISIRDLVSDNKFIFSPKYQAELYNYYVRKQTTLPSAMGEKEIWVDTFGEENFVYQCNESYDSSADLASVTLDSDLLAGSTNLVFTYDIAGIKYIKVVVNNAGASGTSNVSTSGDANDRSNPLVYTFNIYDDDSSNNAIIALAPADLTITGADATVGSVIPTEAEFNNESAGKFTQQFIHLRYAAMLPALSNDDDPLHPELHALIREGDCIPYLAASKMLATVKGDERLIIMGRQYNKEAQAILDRVRQHRAGNGPPYDLEPS
jgi:hypothetical protein